MKKGLLILTCFSLILLLGFYSKGELEVTEIDTTIIKVEKTLRYDFILKNIGTNTFSEKIDYPGHHHYGLEVAIRPNKKLAELMELDKDSRYIKMVSVGGNMSGLLEPGVETAFHLEYKIKEDTNLKEVKKYALESTLLILHGMKVVKEIPLNELDN